MELDVKTRKQFQDVLLSAFPSEADLEQMVSFELDENLNYIATGGNYSEVVFKLIKWAQAQGKVEELLTAARSANPGNPKLRSFDEQIRSTRNTNPTPVTANSGNISSPSGNSDFDVFLAHNSLDKPRHQINEKIIITHPQLKSFRNRFGKAHLDLACHAAFPLALTPELLYCLRENFLLKPKNNKHKYQDKTPWIAVSDILLFLCDPVGFELYEFQPEVRHELLVILKQNFGDKRLRQLSDFMVTYIRQKLKIKNKTQTQTQTQTNYRADEDLGPAPHWTALAYFKPEEAVNDIAKALKEALEKPNRNDLVKLTPYIETYADVDPLIQSGFEPLLVFSRGWDAKAQGDTEEAEKNFAKLREAHGEYLIIKNGEGEVQFKIPTPEDDNLQLFEFETVTVNRRGEIIKRERKQARYFTEDLTENLDSINNITLDMVYIPGGKFMMGSPEGEGNYSEKPQHEVTVPAFFMGKYQVTQEQWKAVAALPQVDRELNPEPSRFKGNNLPVERVSWYDAEEFCKRLSQRTGREYRLPSEAEWEYACRAGTTTPFNFGETITSELANYNASYTFADEEKGEYRQKTTPVGQLNTANAFGLYDIHGNVEELCLDDWHDNYIGAPNDGSAWIDDKYEKLVCLRGGSWDNDFEGCHSASRNDDYRAARDENFNIIGFRVVCGVGRALP